MTTLVRILLLVPLCLALVLAFGCSKKNPNAPSSVSGKVTYKGAPVPAGTITFSSPKGAKYPSALAPDGTYTAVDLPSGDMGVTVETESVKGKKATGPLAAKMSKMMGPVPDYAKNAPKGEYVKIPLKYADPKTSPLKTTLKDGKNDYSPDLTD
jgi:hypothetical protein